MPSTMNFIHRYKEILENQRPGATYASASLNPRPAASGRAPTIIGGGGNNQSRVKSGVVDAVLSDLSFMWEQDTEAYHYPALQHDYPYHGGNPEHHQERNTPPHKKKSVLRKVAIGLGLAAAAGGTYAGIKHRKAIGHAADLVMKHGPTAAYHHLRHGIALPKVGDSKKGASTPTDSTKLPTDPIKLTQHAKDTALRHRFVAIRTARVNKENSLKPKATPPPLPNTVAKHSSEIAPPPSKGGKLSGKRKTKKALKMENPRPKAAK